MDVAELILGCVQAAFSLAGVCVAKKAMEVASEVGKNQAKIARDIAEIQGNISKDITNKQILLAQRQFLSALWNDMSSISGVGKDTGWKVILQTVNTLEKVALSCEAGMVDEAVVLRTFRGPFLLHCRQIKGLGPIQGLPKDGGGQKTGEDLINENRALKTMFEKLEQQDTKRDIVVPLLRS